MRQILPVYKVHISGSGQNGLLLAGKTELTDLPRRLTYSNIVTFYTLGYSDRINSWKLLK